MTESTELTGNQVNFDTPGFAVYNQQVDFELSTGGSAYDVANITSIYTSPWIGAGRFTLLDEFFNDPNKTSDDWDAADFLDGTQLPVREQTAPVAIVNFIQYEGWEWGKIAAGGTLVMMPVVIFTMLVRTYLVRGLTAGGVMD